MNPQQSRAHAAYAPFPSRKPTAEGLSQKVMAEKSSAMPSMPDAGFYKCASFLFVVISKPSPAKQASV